MCVKAVVCVYCVQSQVPRADGEEWAREACDVDCVFVSIRVLTVISCANSGHMGLCKRDAETYGMCILLMPVCMFSCMLKYVRMCEMVMLYLGWNTGLVLNEYYLV